MKREYITTLKRIYMPIMLVLILGGGIGLYAYHIKSPRTESVISVEVMEEPQGFPVGATYVWLFKIKSSQDTEVTYDLDERSKKVSSGAVVLEDYFSGSKEYYPWGKPISLSNWSYHLLHVSLSFSNVTQEDYLVGFTFFDKRSREGEILTTTIRRYQAEVG